VQVVQAARRDDFAHFAEGADLGGEGGIDGDRRHQEQSVRQRMTVMLRGRRTPPGCRISRYLPLSHLDFGGVRLTDLADRVGVSKQAVGQLVDDLAEMRMVERAADPTDGRAKRIRLSRRGHAALMHGLGVLQELEEEVGQAVNVRRMRELRSTLQLLIGALEGGAGSAARE
jgi:DNA-binding MarR family transcriptional regulator